MAVNNDARFNPADVYWGEKNIGEQENNWNSVTYNQNGYASIEYCGGGSNGNRRCHLSHAPVRA